MFASEAFLGVRPAQRVTYCCIASPAGPYFASGVRPVSIWISTVYTRAAPGGTGAAKCGGNYAASLIAQQEAAEQGCDQVMFADAAEHRWLEELGGMNVYLVTADNELITPELTGSILEGVTRDSILTLARRVRADPGRAPDRHRRAAGRHRLRAGGRAVRLRDGRGDHPDRHAEGRRRAATPSAPARRGETTAALRKNLLDIQYGRAEDTHGWLRRVLCSAAGSISSRTACPQSGDGGWAICARSEEHCGSCCFWR